MAWTAQRPPQGFTVWQARPIPGAHPEQGGPWLLPWQPVAGHIHRGAVAPLSAAEAHQIARAMRQAFPGSLVAVLLAAAGEPPPATGQPDPYDLPPYSEP